MSMTGEELRQRFGSAVDLWPLNPDLRPDHIRLIRERISSYLRADREANVPPLWGIDWSTAIWITDGGTYDYHRAAERGTAYTIEHILNTKSIPTTHSLWASP